MIKLGAVGGLARVKQRLFLAESAEDAKEGSSWQEEVNHDFLGGLCVLARVKKEKTYEQTFP